ncbi:hypothetical protein HARCEL1_03725 [Halococcoides cellulosivorans]|uniref:Uncharacterized protein n=1 Tax=Halococcoides cellulosivorans TaxID=1679096 RepID=A0A2R4WZD4_9EURY|nr:hypothetical protein HARCEL1_03725 [Halococcoides cellulosivorans]
MDSPTLAKSKILLSPGVLVSVASEGLEDERSESSSESIGATEFYEGARMDEPSVSAANAWI